MTDTITTLTVLVCPECGGAQEANMPVVACQHFFECTSCGVLLRPKRGDCCVFCSYAANRCPPKQLELQRQE